MILVATPLAGYGGLVPGLDMANAKIEKFLFIERGACEEEIRFTFGKS